MHTLFHSTSLGRRVLPLVLAAALLAVPAGCAADGAAEKTGPAEGDAISAEEPVIREPTDPLAPVIPDTPGPKKEGALGEAEEPAPGPDLSQDDDGIQEPSLEEPYDFSAPVPEGPAAADGYFDDAVFIGDSRTEGFMLYAGPSEASYLTAVGLMVDTIFTEPYIRQGEKKVTVMDALAGMDFSKVYLMLGVNELGWVYSSIFQEYYGRIVDAIREINPDAVIYIQSILPVTAAKAASSFYTNTRIQEYNGLLQELCQEKEVYYVNVAEAVADGDGCLPEEDTFDGVHLLPDACKLWMEYLTTHTVEE